MENIFWVTAAVWVFANIYASIKCITSVYSERSQKAYQLLFIWIIPVLGAVLVLFFASQEASGPNFKTTDADPANPEKVGLSDSSSD